MKYYKDINKLPLSIFIEILDTQNINKLVIFGYIKKSKLKKTWDEILFQFSKIMGIENNNHSLGLVKYVSTMNQKIMLIDMCIRSLSLEYNKDIASTLNLLGIRVKIKEDSLVETLNIAISETKRMRFSVSEKEKELKSLNSKDSESASERLGTLLVDISRYQGYKVDDKISVHEFCILVKKYKEYIKEISKKKDGK